MATEAWKYFFFSNFNDQKENEQITKNKVTTIIQKIEQSRGRGKIKVRTGINTVHYRNTGKKRRKEKEKKGEREKQTKDLYINWQPYSTKRLGYGVST